MRRWLCMGLAGVLTVSGVLAESADVHVYTNGAWALEITYMNAGTRSEGQHGRLLENGKPLEAEKKGDSLLTPLGLLKYYGSARKRLWDLTGWNFADRRLIRRFADLPRPGGPLKVYILVGQSNMQGHARVSTFDYLGTDPATAPLLKQMIGADGKPRVLEDVCITYLSESRSGEPTVKVGPLTVGFGAGDDKIGPEYTFGITMRERLGEPILLIKTAWGGKSLHTDFRPPSAATAEAPTGEYYQRMMTHIRQVLADPGQVCPSYNPEAGVEIAGFVWFQGWNDMVARDVYPQRDQPGGYALYTELLAQFIRDVRRDLAAPDMRFVIGVLGVGGPTALYASPRYVPIHQGFRDAMAAPAAMPEFEGNVVAVLTEQFWDPQLDAVAGKKDRSEAEQLIAQGISNQGFHYLGAAKIIGPIGKAFADAMPGK